MDTPFVFPDSEKIEDTIFHYQIHHYITVNVVDLKGSTFPMGYLPVFAPGTFYGIFIDMEVLLQFPTNWYTVAYGEQMNRLFFLRKELLVEEYIPNLHSHNTKEITITNQTTVRGIDIYHLVVSPSYK